MRHLLALALLLCLSATQAQAFGHRGRRARACPPPPCSSYAPPIAYSVPPPAASFAPAAPVAMATTPTPMTAALPVAPSPYEYTADGQTTPAYFMTTDEAGKPIPVQWRDWLFRGGKEAGMPRPPMPILGRLRND